MAVSRTGEHVRLPDLSNIFTIQIPAGSDRADLVSRLLKASAVVHAEPVGTNKPHGTATPNDTLFSLQWSLRNTGQTSGTFGADIKATQAWDITTGSQNTKIGIIDGGVEGWHEDLSGKVSGDVGYGWDGHGFGVAGIAAANSNNTFGVAGVDWNARIISKRIDDASPQATYFAIMDAVLNHGVQIINNSWWYTDGNDNPVYSVVHRMAYAKAYNFNVVAVASMGNREQTHPGQTQYPAGFGQGIIAVGNTIHNDQRNVSSSTGSHISVVAPGTNIWTTVPDPTPTGFYDTRSGTSYVAPHVSGLAGLLLAYNPNLYNDDIQQIIQLSADKVPQMQGQNWTPQHGYGRVNAYEALKRLRAPYVLNHVTTTGGTVHSTSSEYNISIFGASGIPDGPYGVRRREIRKTVTFSYLDEVWAWGRGAASVGWGLSGSGQNQFAMGFVEPVPGTLTNTSVTLRTYIYEVKRYNTIGQFMYSYGWQPATADNVNFAYTIHGIPGSTPPSPPSLSINTSGFSPELNWGSVSGATSYKIYSGTVAGAPGTVNCNSVSSFSLLDTTTSTSYTDYSVIIDPYESIYVCYYVIAVHGSSESNPSNKVGTHAMAPLKEIAERQIPDDYTLFQNYPNPFNPSTTFAFGLPEEAQVSLKVFNMTGQMVATLMSDPMSAGLHEVNWQADRLPSGIYILQMQAVGVSGETHRFMQKLTLLK